MQGDLAVRNANLNPDKKIKVTNLATLKDPEKASIVEAIKNAHDTDTQKEKDRIKEVTFEGTNAKITYKDGQSRTKPISDLAVAVNPPVIESLSGRGGLPDQSITVSNVLPGATVTLTVAGRQIEPKRVADNATSVTFTAEDLRTAYTANNGLLPLGNVTAIQSVPAGPNTNEVLTSEQGTGNITRETVKPVATTTVQVKNPTTGQWEDVPFVMEDNARKYTFYAGDQLRFITKFSDNSGKIYKTEVKIGDSNGRTTVTSGNILDDSWGTAALTNLNNTPTGATGASPYIIDTGESNGQIKSDLRYTIDRQGNPNNRIKR